MQRQKRHTTTPLSISSPEKICVQTQFTWSSVSGATAQGFMCPNHAVRHYSQGTREMITLKKETVNAKEQFLGGNSKGGLANGGCFVVISLGNARNRGNIASAEGHVRTTSCLGGIALAVLFYTRSAQHPLEYDLPQSTGTSQCAGLQ